MVNIDMRPVRVAGVFTSGRGRCNAQLTAELSHCAGLRCSEVEPPPTIHQPSRPARFRRRFRSLMSTLSALASTTFAALALRLR